MKTTINISLVFKGFNHHHYHPFQKVMEKDNAVANFEYVDIGDDFTRCSIVSKTINGADDKSDAIFQLGDIVVKYHHYSLSDTLGYLYLNGKEIKWGADYDGDYDNIILCGRFLIEEDKGFSNLRRGILKLFPWWMKLFRKFNMCKNIRDKYIKELLEDLYYKHHLEISAYKDKKFAENMKNNEVALDKAIEDFKDNWNRLVKIGFKPMIKLPEKETLAK